MDIQALDFETENVGYFEKKQKKKDYKGHPRLVKPKVLTSYDGKKSLFDDTLANPYSIEDKTLAFHNLSFDWPVGSNSKSFQGTPADLHCTRTMAKLLDNSCPVGLKPLAVKHLNESIVDYKTAERLGGETFKQYAINDSVFTYKLFQIFNERLQRQKMWKLYEIERDFLFVNSEIEQNGIRIDTTTLHELKAQLKKEIRQASPKLGKHGLNWRSPKQLSYFLYSELKLPVVLEAGKNSTAKAALQKLEPLHPSVGVLLKLREKDSLRRDLESYSRFIDPSTGAIHPYIDTLGADTGRATSKFPNMQNLKKDPRFRSLFVARPGHDLVVFDYSQIEPRVLAHFSDEGKLKSLFLEEGDFYTNFSSIIFKGLNQAPDRDVSKLLILAITYGMSVHTVANTLKTSPGEARKYFEQVEQEFPEIDRLRSQVLCKARTTGYAVGLLGRRRYLPGINSDSVGVRSKAERQAFNAVIQGSAATVFKHKLNQLRKALPKEIKFLNHVHDEVVLESPKHLTKEVYEVSKKTLEKPISWFSVPLVADGGVGQTWAEAKN